MDLQSKKKCVIFYYITCDYITCEFVKKEEHLIYKFNELQTNHTHTHTHKKKKNQYITTKYVKQSIIHLIDIALTKQQISLINLGLNFVPTHTKKLLWKLLQQRDQWH